jgi:autotransporter-associated beta strand protein
MKTKTAHRFPALAAICMAMSGAASAVTQYWDGNATTINSASDNTSTSAMNWLSGGNWDNGSTSAPLGSWAGGDTAIFGGSTSGTQTVTLGSGISLGNGTTIGGTGSSYLISVTGTGYNQFGPISGTITINAGSTLSADAPSNNAHNLGALTLNGGTLTSANGPAGPANDDGYGNWLVRGVTAGGSSLSTISSSTLYIVSDSFNVADAVAGSGSDLLVSSKIISGALSKDGAGTMELTGANTYAGGTTVNNGTLRVSGSSGSLGTGAIQVGTGSTLEFSTAGSKTIANNISGLGTILNDGAGTTELTGANTYAGGTTVSNGTLLVSGSNGSLGSGAIQVGSGSTLEFSTTGSKTIANNISGSGAIIKNGSGADRYSFSGDNSGFTGTYTQTGAQTGFTSATAGSAGASWVINGDWFTTKIGTATLKLGALSGSANHWNDSTSGTTTLEIGEKGTDTTFSGIIGYGTEGAITALTKTGAGTFTLTGNNNYSGPTSVNQGKLVIDGNISTSSLTTVAAGAALGGTGTVGALTVDGILAPGNSIGTITATADVTWNDNDSWVFELGTAASTLALAGSGSSTQDLLNITGGSSDFLKGSGSSFTFDFANGGAVGYYKLVDWAGTTDFVDGDFVATNLLSGLTGSFTVDSGTSALYLHVVPEPNVAALIGGFGILGLLRRRR